MINSPIVEAALDAYRRGHVPVPVKPGEKRPSVHAWASLDFGSATEVEELFAAEQDPNVGVLLGEASGGLIDIDLDHPKASRLAAMVLPATPARSGRPSRPHTHHWFIAIDDLPASRRFRLPDGETLLEIRSSGAQTVIPPSLHPERERYIWHGPRWGGEDGPLRFPGKDLHARVLTLAMLGTLLDAWPQRGGRHEAFLALAGGLLRYGGVDGETGAVHPLWEAQASPLIQVLAEATEDEDGPDARIAESLDSTMKALRAGKRVNGFPTLAKIIGQPHASLAQELARDLETLLGFPTRGSLRVAEEARLVGPADSGDLGARDPHLSRDRENSVRGDEADDPLLDRKNGWGAVDLHAYLIDPNTGPKSGVLYRNDGVGLLYQGRVNSLYGAAGSAKTWLALYAMSCVLSAGGSAMLVDCEDGPNILIKRLRLLGVNDLAIRERLVYLNPDEPLGSLMVDRWGHPAANETGLANERELRAALDLIQPELIIIDGTTSLYGMHSLSTNDAASTDKITSWLRRLTNGGQRTVLMIDHTSKKAGVGEGPTGSQHKVAMVQGVALHVLAAPKPRVGHVGKLQIHIGKDRPGLVSEHLEDPHVDDEMIAEVTVNSITPGEVSISVAPPSPTVAYTDPSQARKTQLSAVAQAILAVLDDAPGWFSRSGIESEHGAPFTDYQFKKAVRELSGKIEIDGDTRNRRYRKSVPD